jgi:hypothetical protein
LEHISKLSDSKKAGISWPIQRLSASLCSIHPFIISVVVLVSFFPSCTFISSFLCPRLCSLPSALTPEPHVWVHPIPLMYDRLSTYEIHLPMSALSAGILSYPFLVFREQTLFDNGTWPVTTLLLDMVLLSWSSLWSPQGDCEAKHSCSISQIKDMSRICRRIIF